MLRSRQLAAWDHTAAIVATVINANRGKGTPAVKPEALNPYRGEGGGNRHRLNRDNIHLLKAIAGKVSA